MAARPDVDPDRIALIGVSQAGYWVPRARLRASLRRGRRRPGVVDVSTSWTGQLPGFMRSQLQDPSKKDSFDKEMGWTERFCKSTRATLHHCEPMGLAGRDARVFDWLDRYLTT
jgi:hypothetical protein